MFEASPLVSATFPFVLDQQWRSIGVGSVYSLKCSFPFYPLRKQKQLNVWSRCGTTLRQNPQKRIILYSPARRPPHTRKSFKEFTQCFFPRRSCRGSKGIQGTNNDFSAGCQSCNHFLSMVSPRHKTTPQPAEHLERLWIRWKQMRRRNS